MHPSVTHAKIALRIPRWLGYAEGIYRGIENYLTENRLRWEIESDLSGDGELETFCIDENWCGDGAILFRYSDAEADVFLRRNVPLVSVSRESPATWVPRVHADNYMLGRLAAEHLICTASPHLCCWFDPNRAYSVERKNGFVDFAQERNRAVTLMEVAASLISSKEKWKELNVRMLQELEKLELPAAIFARDDIAATGLLRMIRSLELSSPEDISILGVGNYPGLSAITTPSMSSVVIPACQIGWHAARLLHERLQMENPCADENAEVVELPVTEVIQRESTSHHHVENPLVDRACQMVRKQLAERKKVNVARLCEMLGVSSSLLLKAFNVHLGVSPKQFIAKAQFVEAKRLLSQTSWSVKRISYELGFRSPGEFSRFFKRHAGVSPVEFRQRDWNGV